MKQKIIKWLDDNIHIVIAVAAVILVAVAGAS